jgi:hypothetical protein
MVRTLPSPGITGIDLFRLLDDQFGSDGPGSLCQTGVQWSGLGEFGDRRRER